MDGTFSVPIVVVSTCASKANVLTEVFKVKFKRMGCESGSVIRKVRLGNDSVVKAHGLICLLAQDGFMTVEALLKFNMNVIRCMINEDTASGEHFIVRSFTF